MKKTFLLLVLGVGALTADGIAAQELLVPPLAGSLDDLPPQLPLPDAATLDTSTGDAGSSLTPEPIDAGDLAPPLEPFVSDNDVRLFDCNPALLESTGTWLRRGFWFAEVDAVLFDRIWRKDNLILLRRGGIILFDNTLELNGGHDGAETAPRLKIGRFLFRDHKNRDHTAEFIAYGGGQWSQIGRLDGAAGLIVNPDLNRNGLNPSFNGATSSQFAYDSRFNSFELNYSVKHRMRKDRMELEPSGQWVRRAQVSPTWSLLAGVRFFDFTEDLVWQAFGILDADGDGDTESGDYRIRADNDLIGPQVGFGWAVDTARWSAGIGAKGGMFLNMTDIRSQFDITGGIGSGNNFISIDNLSFLTEAGVFGKWHLRPNLSLRTGLEILYISSLTHAPDQINFASVATSGATTDGDSTYLGGSIGIEGYW